MSKFISERYIEEIAIYKGKHLGSILKKIGGAAKSVKSPKTAYGTTFKGRSIDAY